MIDQDKLVVGLSLKPVLNDRNILRTGFGIIVDIKENSQQYKTILGEYQYTVMTDFGNTIKLTYEELCTLYEEAPRGVDNLYERLTLQLDLITQVRELYCNT